MDGFVWEPCIPPDDLARMSTVGKANQKYGLVARPLRVYTGIQQAEFWTASFTDSIWKYGHEAK